MCVCVCYICEQVGGRRGGEGDITLYILCKFWRKYGGFIQGIQCLCIAREGRESGKGEIARKQTDYSICE